MPSHSASWLQWFSKNRRNKRTNQSSLDTPATSENECGSEIALGLIEGIVKSHTRLQQLDNLRPGDAINDILTRLVSTCCQIHTKEITAQILADPEVQSILPSLRQICSEAECHLEAHWAKYIQQARDSADAETRLKQFPYHQNYVDLTRLEVSSLYAAIGALPQRIAFIGSGPLPLSSLCMLDLLNDWQHMSSKKPESTAAQIPTTTVVNIDCSRTAIEASSLMTAKLHGRRETDSGIDVDDRDEDKSTNGEMQFICEGAGESDLTSFDTVFLAALVGQTQPEKERLLLKVVSRMKSGASLLVRTSWGLRTCLYPEVDLTTANLAERLKVCSVVHPYSDVVNSIIIAQVR